MTYACTTFGLRVIFLGVFFYSRVTGACRVTTDLIMRVNVKTTSTSTKTTTTTTTTTMCRSYYRHNDSSYLTTSCGWSIDSLPPPPYAGRNILSDVCVPSLLWSRWHDRHTLWRVSRPRMCITSNTSTIASTINTINSTIISIYSISSAYIIVEHHHTRIQCSLGICIVLLALVLLVLGLRLSVYRIS